MRKKTTIRFTESEKNLIKKTAEYLGWNFTEVIRRSLRFGINSLLKFETNKKMDLRMLEALEDPTKQANDKPKEEKKEEPQQPSIEEQIETFCILAPEEPRKFIESWIRSGTNQNYNDWKKENIK